MARVGVTKKKPRATELNGIKKELKRFNEQFGISRARVRGGRRT